jgi:predicted GNAT family acetyltransferase
MTVRDDSDRSRYEIEVEGKLAGFIDYRSRNGIVTMVHTEVDPQWEGHGVGAELVRGALGDVRSRGLSVRAVCPFVAAYIERHPEYQDLVAS